MKRNMLFGLAALAAVTAAGCANAHGVWFAPRLDKTQLVLGEGPKDNAYDPKAVTMLQGYDAEWGKVAVESVNGGDHITIVPAENVAVVAVEFDYGYWSNGKDGKWHNAPMDQVEGSTVGTHAVKYGVSSKGIFCDAICSLNKATDGCDVLTQLEFTWTEYCTLDFNHIVITVQDTIYSDCVAICQLEGVHVEFLNVVNCITVTTLAY